MSKSSQLVRLNKFIAQCGIASRRGADELVFSGRVLFNDTIADSPGIKVDPAHDIVKVNGKRIGGSQQTSETTLLLHKPIEVVTTAKDPQNRTTVLDLLPSQIRSLRPFPVGRLDFYSEGLLLLTTDGDLCYRLTHPKYHLPKVYTVTIRGLVPEKAIHSFRSGMTLHDGTRLAPVQVTVKKPIAGTQQVELTLIQGINRQIRRMFADFDLTILKLRRIQQGPLSLGQLKSGESRELTKKELELLQSAVGLK